MITPAYSATATERVLPRLDLNFTLGSLDARVAITRALNTATAINSSGFVATVNADLPRFDYDPVTLACKGLLIEEARTNLTPYSADYSTWSKIFTVDTPNQGVAPDGLNNATKIVPSIGQAFSWLAQPGIPASTGTYTLSVYAKSAGLTAFQIGFFNTADSDKFGVYTLSGSGAVASSSAGTTASIQSAGNGWYRCILTFTTTGIVSTQIQISRLSAGVGDGVNGWLVWGAQLEDGAFATSYIPTTATSLVRNADVVTMTGANFSDWFNASEGAFSVRSDVYSNNTSPARSTLLINKAGTGFIQFKVTRPNTFTGVTVTDDTGATAADLSGNILPVNTFTTVVGAYKTNSFSFADGGSAASTDLSGSVPTGLTQMVIGSDGTNFFQNGHISSVRYWPQRLTDAETQAFSK